MAYPETLRAYSVDLPASLHRRATIVSKRFKIPISAILRDGVAIKVAELETQILLEEETSKKIQEVKTPTRFTARKLGDYLNERAEKRAKVTPPASHEKSPEKSRDSLPPLPGDGLRATCAAAAERVLLAGDDRAEQARVVREAIAKVKRDHPLTHPEDQEILLAIEREVVRQRDEGPTERRALDALYDDHHDHHEEETP